MLTADLIQWYCGTCGTHGAWWDVPATTEEVAAKVWRTHLNETPECEGQPDLHWSASRTEGVAPPVYRGSAARIDQRLPLHWAQERQKQQQQTVEQAAEEEKRTAERQRRWQEQQAAEQREWLEERQQAQQRLIEAQRLLHQERQQREAQRAREQKQNMERLRAEYAERRALTLAKEAERERRLHALCERMDRVEHREAAFRRATAPFERPGLYEPLSEMECPYFSEPFTIAPVTD